MIQELVKQLVTFRILALALMAVSFSSWAAEGATTSTSVRSAKKPAAVARTAKPAAPAAKNTVVSTRAAKTRVARTNTRAVSRSASVSSRGGRKSARHGRETVRVAPEAAIQGQLAKLAPETRMEQRCNARAMNAVQTEHKDMRPDRLVAYAFGDPEIKDGLLKAKGAAVRSGSSWFRMSYTCQTGDDGMSVKSFEFKLGDIVPRKDWDDHLLVPP